MLTNVLLVYYIVKQQQKKDKKDFKKCNNNEIISCLWGYGNTYNAEILNFFNPKIQLKDTESVINNKLTELVATLVLEFEKIGQDYETKYSTFYLATKAETIILESEIDVFDPSILWLYQTSKICS